MKTRKILIKDICIPNSDTINESPEYEIIKYLDTSNIKKNIIGLGV
jgi:hypothetical protein